MLFNKKRTKNTTKRIRDTSQFIISVLNFKYKRTIDELDYNKLILLT